MATQQCAGWLEPPHRTTRLVAKLERMSGARLTLCECCLRDYLHDPKVSEYDRRIARVALEVLRPWLEDR